MNKQLEKPFEYLIRKYNEQGKETGKKEKFYSDIVNNPVITISPTGIVCFVDSHIIICYEIGCERSYNISGS